MAKTRTVHLAHTLFTYDFPVNPKELTIDDPASVSRYNILQRGESSASGFRQLKQLNFTTFIPSEKSIFISKTELNSPSSIISKLQDIKNSGKPCRIIIGKDEENGEYYLTNVRKVYEEGDNDVGVSLSFLEYRPVDSGQASNRPVTPDTGLKDTAIVRREFVKKALAQQGEAVADKINQKISDAFLVNAALEGAKQIDAYGYIKDPGLKAVWEKYQITSSPKTENVDIPPNFYRTGTGKPTELRQGYTPRWRPSGY